MNPDEPVSNDDLVRVEIARAVPPWDSCTGCQRALDKDEKFVYVLLGHDRLGVVKLCRYCVLKIHRTSTRTDL